MTKLQIDSEKGTIHLELELKGEATAITVEVGRYTVIEQTDKTFVELANLQASREWINVLLGEYVKEFRFEVPRALKLLL